ncbi:MAG: hypothetical protein ACOZBZ_04955 [Patescibacteria group bacterium]
MVGKTGWRKEIPLMVPGRDISWMVNYDEKDHLANSLALVERLHPRLDKECGKFLLAELRINTNPDVLTSLLFDVGRLKESPLKSPWFFCEHYYYGDDGLLMGPVVSSFLFYGELARGRVIGVAEAWGELGKPLPSRINFPEAVEEFVAAYRASRYISPNELFVPVPPPPSLFTRVFRR